MTRLILLLLMAAGSAQEMAPTLRSPGGTVCPAARSASTPLIVICSS